MTKRNILGDLRFTFLFFLTSFAIWLSSEKKVFDEENFFKVGVNFFV